MNAASRAQLQIHFCVVLWGFTAIFGKLISLPAVALVWWRMLLVVVALLALPRFWRGWRSMSGRLRAIYAGIGIVVAVHWCAFYGAIKLANASVAAVCMAFAPVCVALTEPLLVGRRFEARELLIGLATIPGIALIVGGTPSAMNAGIAIGTLSAALAGLFATLNKRYAGCGDPLAVTGIELAAGTLFLTLMAPLLADSSVFAWPGREDAFYLVLLAYVCTLLPFAVSLLALRELSAFSTQLAVSLEPIYAICLAIVLLGEQRELSPQFYVGVVIVLLAVFSHAGLAYRGRRNLASR